MEITSDFEALKASWLLLVNTEDSGTRDRAMELVREFGMLVAPEDISLAREQVIAEMKARCG